MWSNYFRVAFRAMARNKTQSFINILGLGVGLAACLLLLLYVRYETSYDDWLPDAERTYQVQTWFPQPADGEARFTQRVAYKSGAAMAKEFPEIERQVYALPSAPVFVSDGVPYPTEDYLFVGDDLLDVLSLPILHGDRGALDLPGNAALSREEALRRFGTGNPVGRTFTLISKGLANDYRVAAVLDDLPRKSHLKISAVVRVDMRSYMAKEPVFFECWSCPGGFIYARLRSGADAGAINERLVDWEKRNIPDENLGGARFNAGDDADWRLVDVRDVHLGRAQIGAMTPGNDRTTMITFGLIALLILITATVNFINLTTSRASQRAREVAVRKVLGANKRHLVQQFIAESVMITFVAGILSVALLELATPAVAALLDIDLRLAYFGAGGILLPLLALVLVVGILGGAYPAFFLSRFQPASVLKANKSSSDTPGSRRLRGALVVVQFAVSIGLIVCTAIIYSQTVYARSTDPGYRRDGILQIDGLNRYQLIGKGEMIAQQMRRIPGVQAVGRSSLEIGDNAENTIGIAEVPVTVPGMSKPVTIGVGAVDESFLDAAGLTMLHGRWYDPNRPQDDATLSFPPTPEGQAALVGRGVNVVVNQLAARKLGYRDPSQIVGRTFSAGLVQPSFGGVPVTVTGVVRDARFRSVRVPVDPMIFLNTDNGHVKLLLRYHGEPGAVRAQAERIWKGITAEVPFEARFSEDIVRELYEPDTVRARAFAGFALLSVILSCLGLFALAAFAAERRTKEIGIRRVLGARTRDVVRLLVWEFSKPVLIANLIAWPVAWWAMRDWLNGFDDRVQLTVSPFLLAGALAFAVAIATVTGHAVRVARKNPVQALRYE